MRRLFIIASILLLGIMPLRALPAAAADNLYDCPMFTEDDQFWSAVCQPILEEGVPPLALPGVSQVLQPYAVVFREEFAATPPLRDAEFMVIYVKDGVFVLDRKSGAAGSVVVSATAATIPVMQKVPAAPFYEVIPGDVLKNSDGTDCSRSCPVAEGQPVQLKAGDMAIAEAGTLCLWCLLGTNAVKDGETGILEVYALQDPGLGAKGFSWFRNWGVTPPEALATPTMFRSWAYSPPGTKCGGG
jgi:hypothetical protein